jgi:hypothetical protein
MVTARLPRRLRLLAKTERKIAELFQSVSDKSRSSQRHREGGPFITPLTPLIPSPSSGQALRGGLSSREDDMKSLVLNGNLVSGAI